MIAISGSRYSERSDFEKTGVPVGVNYEEVKKRFDLELERRLKAAGGVATQEQVATGAEHQGLFIGFQRDTGSRVNARPTPDGGFEVMPDDSVNVWDDPSVYTLKAPEPDSVSAPEA